MQQQWAFATMPLRGLRLDAPLAAPRGDVMRALMLGCAAIDKRHGAVGHPAMRALMLGCAAIDKRHGAVGHPATRALMLGCAAIDTPYRCHFGNGTHMRHRQRHKAMPFREWHSYVALTLPLGGTGPSSKAVYLG